jgi:hypothetical protein
MPPSADSGHRAHGNEKKALQRRGSKRNNSMLNSHQEEHESSEEEEGDKENIPMSSSSKNSIAMNPKFTDRESDGDVDNSDRFKQRNEIIFIGSNICLLILSFGILLYLLSYSKEECPTL